MAGGAVAAAPAVLVASALGSCVALALYARPLRLGGLAHIMLPCQDSAQVVISPYQYADSALPALLAELQNRGAQPSQITARIVGGANMFGFSLIGMQTVASLRRLLQDAGIALTGAAVGGRQGRSVSFYLDSGKLLVQVTGQADLEI